ncbi:hypothetical protein AgCh_019677 [Apium graveolens]
MSITAGLPLVQDKGHQISYIRRHDNSVELDVFDAAEYFSGANEIYGASFTLQQKLMRSGGRISLDVPMMSGKSSSIPSPSRCQKSKEEKKKYKQPSTPSGKLASLLNSLFNHISSKKKSSYTQSMKGDQDHKIGRRPRRSSISHFRNLNTISSSISNSSDSNSSSFYSSLSTSEFKTPPDAHTAPKNSSKNIQSHSNPNLNMMVISTNLSKMNYINFQVQPPYYCSSPKNICTSEKTDKFWLNGEKFKIEDFDEILLEKCSKIVKGGLGGKSTDDHSEDSTKFRNFINNKVDHGADSDSSSDFFDLQNFDLVSISSNSLS